MLTQETPRSITRHYQLTEERVGIQYAEEQREPIIEKSRELRVVISGGPKYLSYIQQFDKGNLTPVKKIKHVMKATFSIKEKFMYNREGCAS